MDYKLFFDNALGIWQTLDSSITTLTYTAINLTPGLRYKFKIQSRNAFGYSVDSLVTEILAAQEPAQPLAPITTFQRETVLIEWVAPNDLGSSITAYNIYIKKSDGTFSLELNDCDGTDTTIISDTACTILVSTLINTPFSLAWGSDIYAEVVAINDYGRSLTSE